MTYTLYGMAASLYTARARSYMRTNAVPFVEVKAGGEEFVGQVVPLIGRWIIPVIKTPEGAIIQDGVDIIDHLDGAGFSKWAIYPEAPALLVVAHLFELFGSHGLLRPAMHYRWNFDAQNLAFLRNGFRDVLPSGLPAEAEDAVFEQASGRMRQAAVAFGVTPETYTLVEERYRLFLALFEQHLRAHPFILGGHPTIADYGMIGAMHAHLGRDPVPLHLMQTTAPNVFRWVERMTMTESFVDESFARAAGELFDPDALPETLLALMRFVAEDYLIELAAHVERANAWLADQDSAALDSAFDAHEQAKVLGVAPFDWHGARIATVVLPYRFYLLQRLQEAHVATPEAERQKIETLFEETGLREILALRTNRRVERIDNCEVWGQT
ncbi:glutathione S-transferase C-terminal domain-containing protein [Erythrobacter sp.]|uniref:glutathione S-transferase C-terminal domain-containing protein n=1 Tax=Erythrobacter sp. TaxID=1042 RepID=UPI00311E040B